MILKLCGNTDVDLLFYSESQISQKRLIKYADSDL